jgi:hypothetical protein
VTDPATTPPRQAPHHSSWRWSTWSLTRKLPVLTGAIVVLVVAILLLLTYNALVSTRLEAIHDRLKTIAEQIAANSQQTTRARFSSYERAAADPAVVGLLRTAAAVPAGAPAASDSAPAMKAAAARLLQLRAAPDSSLPIELWTTDGRRVLRVGTEVRDDRMAGVRPELRTQSGSPVTEVPSGEDGLDSARYGTLYASGGRVYFWTVVPVFDGKRRLGYLTQQRLYRTTPQSERLVRELIGNDVSLYLHNVTDDFWTTYLGTPTQPLAGVDTTKGDFVGTREGVGTVTAYDQRVPGTPWALTLEAPV